MTVYDFSYTMRPMDLSPLKEQIRRLGILKVSGLTGLSRSTINDFANRDKGISLQNLEKIALSLGFEMKVERAQVTPPSLKDVIKILKEHELDLKKAGIESVAVFGSVAKNKARAGSDIDLLIRNKISGGLKPIVAAESALESLFPTLKVDMVFEHALNKPFREAIAKEIVVVF